MLLSNKHVDNGNIELLNKKKALLYISAFFHYLWKRAEKLLIQKVIMKLLAHLEPVMIIFN